MTLRRSPLFRCCLALLLVFAQQQAVVHALEHEGGRLPARAASGAPAGTNDGAGHPAELCAKCLALAHLHHASGVAEVRLAVSSYTPPRIAQVRTARASSDVVLGYLSRAPPYFS